MHKSELVAAVTEHVDGVDKKTVAKVLDGLLDVIPLAVAAGEQVEIKGFGVFEASERSARAGRNPQTGEPMEIPASWGPKFRPGATFKGLVSASKSLTSA
ncbi:HU family DNA-binding protein [Streptosporangium sp. NPDC002721]|uniref:HU family DNA-binding protein n=1 Tax=Streptosporangium sp. NPDC002721 TaxID=3366188 RepID=UPI0036A16906